MALHVQSRVLKREIPGVTANALSAAGLTVDDQFDLNMRVLMSRIEVLEVSGQGEHEYAEFFIIGAQSIQGTRTSFLSVNLFSLAAAIMALARAPSDPGVFVVFIMAFAAAFTSKLSQEQAAFFVAVQMLDGEGRELTISNLAVKIGSLIYKPTYSGESTEKLIDSLRAQGVDIKISNESKKIVAYKERAIFLPI